MSSLLALQAAPEIFAGWQGDPRGCPRGINLRIVTPWSDPAFETKEYQAFLRLLGYEPVEKAAYGKLL